MILFGHPTGNPNAHHAALAHYEAGCLEAFAVPWFPSRTALWCLRMMPLARALAARLERRRFEPLAGAPKIQGRLGEFKRLAIRAFGRGDERLSYEGNDWLMRTMARASHREGVTAVHCYEDASLWSFQEAKKIGKACIYDMPIGFYSAWERTEVELVRRYSDWLPANGLPSSRYVRPQQKRLEMELADLVLVPSSFAEETIRASHPYKRLARAPYGVDLSFWQPSARKRNGGALRFIYAGQLSLRKGTPLLIQAWEKANLVDAQLDLVGAWQLAESKRLTLPRGVTCWPPCDRAALRERYRAADVFLFPSFFEGFGLVLLEAMACGLPAITSEATAGSDVMTSSCGRLLPTGDLEALVESLRWFAHHRDQLPEMSRAARAQAERCTWENYRRCVTDAVAPFV